MVDKDLPYLDRLIAFFSDEEVLLGIFGLGEQGVRALVSWFQDPKHQQLLKTLHDV